MIGLKIREAHLVGSNVPHTEIPRHGQQAGGPIPGERSEKRFPLGQQPSRLASRQHRAGKGKGLANQRANIVPAASGKPQRLGRYRLQPLPQSGRIGVDLAGRRAEQPRGRPYRRDLVALLNRRQIRLLDQGDEIGEGRS